MPKFDPATGIWNIGGSDVEDKKEHKFDHHVALSVANLLKQEDAGDIMDFGCGNGSYVFFLRDMGFSVQGCDGNRNTPQLTSNTCSIQDLSKAFDWGTQFDWSVCLEVGEHIPLERERTFLDNLAIHTRRGLILSWALPGQGGCGHLNEQPNDYVIERMASREFEYDEEESLKLRENTHWWWFEKTLMVFRNIIV